MSHTLAVLIPFAATKPVQVVALKDGLNAIYELVAPDSRRFEVVRSETFDLLGDEEGGPGCRNDAEERINVRAMELLAVDQQVGPEAFASPLCGDFLVTGHPDDDGNSTDAPMWTAQHSFSWTLEKR